MREESQVLLRVTPPTLTQDMPGFSTSQCASPDQSSLADELQLGRFNLDPDDVKKGMGRLVLTLLKLLHQLLEKQAVRRLESGGLTDEQAERLGLTLMRQAEALEELREAFGLTEADLNLDLGPLGRLL